MEEKNLQIIGFEHKVGKSNNPYVVFNTNEGKMSCFEKEVSDKVIKCIGGTALVECFDNQVGDKTYWNIRGYVGGQEQTNPMTKPINTSSNEVLIASELKKVQPQAPKQEYHLTIEQVRSNALHEAVKIKGLWPDDFKGGVVEVARQLTTFILNG